MYKYSEDPLSQLKKFFLKRKTVKEIGKKKYKKVKKLDQPYLFMSLKCRDVVKPYIINISESRNIETPKK